MKYTGFKKAIHNIMPVVLITDSKNLLLEWFSDGNPTIDISLYKSAAYFHAFAPDRSDVEYSFNLRTFPGWLELTRFTGTKVITFDNALKTFNAWTARPPASATTYIRLEDETELIIRVNGKNESAECTGD